MHDFCWLPVEKATFIQEDSAVGCDEAELLGAPDIPSSRVKNTYCNYNSSP